MYVKFDTTKKKEFEITDETKSLFSKVKNNRDTYQVLIQCKNDPIALYLYLLYQINTIRGIQCKDISIETDGAAGLKCPGIDMQKVVKRSQEIYEYIKTETGCDFALPTTSGTKKFATSYINEVEACWSNLNNWGAFYDLKKLKTRLMILQMLCEQTPRLFMSDVPYSTLKYYNSKKLGGNLLIFDSNSNDNDWKNDVNVLIIKRYKNEIMKTIQDVSISIFGRVEKMQQPSSVKIIDLDTFEQNDKPNINFVEKLTKSNNEKKDKKEIIAELENHPEICFHMNLHMFNNYCANKNKNKDLDVTGIYILKDLKTNKPYVGQGKKCLNRCRDHFSKSNKGEVNLEGSVANLYFKHGHDFQIEYIIPLTFVQKFGIPNNIDFMEHFFIEVFDACGTNGINKVKGSQGFVNNTKIAL